MKKWLVCLFLTIFQSAVAQQKINHVEFSDIKNHIGDTITLIEKIYKTDYVAAAKGSPTYLYIGKDSSKLLVYVRIWGKNRKNFPQDPYVYYKNKVLRVTGVVQVSKNGFFIDVEDFSSFEEIQYAH